MTRPLGYSAVSGVGGGAVASVAGKTGAVTLTASDVSAAPAFATQSKSANFTATVGVLHLVDTTAGAVTGTLPAASTAGQQLAIKLYAGTNPVNLAVTGTDHIGASATTAQLVLSGEIWEFVSDGAGHWNLVGGNKSLSSLDGRYPKRSDLFYVVTDPAFGADPTGAASSAAAVQAAIDACASTGGTVYIPAGTYKIDSVLNLKAHVNLRGAGQVSRLNAPANGLFTWTTGRLTDFTAYDLKLTVAAGGHVFGAGASYGANQCTIRRCQIVQSDPSYGIWYQHNADSFISNKFVEGDYWMSGSATVPAFDIAGTGGAINNNRFRELTLNGQGGASAEWFRIAENSATYSFGNRWDDIVLENCLGGFVYGWSANKWQFTNIDYWDASASYARDLIFFGTGSGGSAPASRNIELTAIARNAPGTLAGGVFDINAAAVSAGTFRLKSGSTSGVTALTVNLPVGAMVDNMIGASGMSDVQVFTANGTWTKPVWAGANCITQVLLVAGGGGGGSGSRQAAGTAAGGGAGGGPAGKAVDKFLTGSLPGTVAVTVGGAGAAGAAVTTDTTNGNPGGVGGPTTFSTLLAAPAGAGGGGGTLTTNAGGAGGASLIGSTGTGGTQGTNGVAGNNGASGTVSGGGGGGGGLTAANATSGGGLGRSGSANLNATYAGGSTPGQAGTAGASQPTNSAQCGGSGGGGASGDTGGTVAGGAGGAGGLYGGAGGGGGGSRNGANSGAGGVGSAGIAVVITSL